MSNKQLRYSVIKDDDGFIAECVANPKISVFSKDEKKLDEGINKAAKMYAKFNPDDEHNVLLKDDSLRLTRQD